MNLEDIIKWNKSVTEKTNTVWFHLCKVSKIVQLLEAEHRQGVARCWEGEMGSCYSTGIKFSNARWVNSRDLLYNIVPTQYCVHALRPATW